MSFLFQGPTVSRPGFAPDRLFGGGGTFLMSMTDTGAGRPLPTANRPTGYLRGSVAQTHNVTATGFVGLPAPAIVYENGF